MGLSPGQSRPVLRSERAGLARRAQRSLPERNLLRARPLCWSLFSGRPLCHLGTNGYLVSRANVLLYARRAYAWSTLRGQPRRARGLKWRARLPWFFLLLPPQRSLAERFVSLARNGRVGLFSDNFGHYTSQAPPQPGRHRREDQVAGGSTVHLTCVSVTLGQGRLRDKQYITRPGREEHSDGDVGHVCHRRAHVRLAVLSRR